MPRPLVGGVTYIYTYKIREPVMTINNPITFTSEQLAFIHAPESRVVLVAPAGTGKTETIAGRAQRLFCGGESALITTFTHSARHTIQARLDMAGVEGTVRTVTSLAVELVLAELPWLAVGDGKPIARRACNHTPVSVSDLLRFEALLASNAPIDSDEFAPEIEHVFKDYVNLKQRTGYATYTDCLSMAVDLAKPVGCEVIVDEAQDLTPLQWVFLQALQPKRLVLAGDPAQAIYGFNGVNANLLPDVVKQGFAQYVLTRSYRTPSSHLEVVNAHRSTLITSAREGGTLTRVCAPTTAEAVEFINTNAKPGDVVLGLTATRLATFRNAFEQANPGVLTTVSSEGTLNPETLMFATIHAFKGQQANRAFVLDVAGNELTGWNQNGDTESHNLFYVACSRALKDLYLLDKGEHSND